MSHVEKRGTGRKPWVAVYADPSNKSGRGAKSFARRVDAERFLAVTATQQLRGEWVDPKSGKVTVREYAETWLAARAIRESTRTRYADYIGHICRRLGDWQLGQLTPSVVEQWQTALARDLAPSTVNTIRGVFVSMLKSAARDRLISGAPFDGVPAVRVARRLIVPLELAHVVAVRDAITPRLRAAVVVGAGCGLRRGETLGLTADRVDFLRRAIRVDRQLVAVAGDGRPVFGPPKTAASVRTVPMPQTVVDDLAAHLARWPADANPDGLIFTAPRGGAVGRAQMGAAWRDAEIRVWAAATGHKLAGGWRIPADVADAWRVEHPNGHGTRFHDLRHFYASALIAAGRSVKEVQARLGHATAVETLDTYAHLWPNNEDGTRAVIDDLFTEPATTGDTAMEVSE